MSRPFVDYLLRVPPQSYEDEEPISAYRALALRNKLQLLTDLSTQVRINVAAVSYPGIGFDGFSIDASTTERFLLWTQEFELSWLRPDWPAGLDICMALFRGAGGSSEAQAVIRIVPASAAVNDLSAPVLYTGQVATSGASTTAVLEEQAFFSTRVDPSGLFLEHSITENGAVQRVRQCLMRAEVALIAPTGTQARITELLVREFVCR